MEGLVATNPETASKSCQTPKEWAVCGLEQERKEAERHRAEPRKRTLQPGTTTPNTEIRAARPLLPALGPNSHARRTRLADKAHEKKPKPELIHLFEPGPADATVKEVLFWSLLLCVTHRGRISELESYARAVLTEEPNITSSWTPSADKWPKDRKLQVSSIHSPLEHAHKRVAWTKGALDAVGLAMQAWRGDGFVNGLTGVILKRYISQPPPGPRTDTKTSIDKLAPRYRSKAVVRVARLLHDHGAKLRRLLNITAESSDAKPMHEVLTELQAQNAKLTQMLSDEQASAKRLQDAWRKAAGRLKAKNHAVTKARRDERTKLQNKHTSFKQTCKQEARADVKDELDRMNRLRNDANARTRKAETESQSARVTRAG